MTLVLPAGPRKMTTAQKLAGGLEKGLGMLSEFQQKQEAKQLQAQGRKSTGDYLESLGIPNATNLPENIQNELVKQYGKYGAKTQALQGLGFGDRIGANQTGFKFGAGQQSEMGPEGNEIQVNLPTQYSEDEIFRASLVDPTIANQMRKANDLAIEEGRHQERTVQRNREIELRERKESPEGKRETAITGAQAKADIDYNKQLQSSATQHQIKTDTLNRLQKLNEKGVTGKPYEKLLEKMGLVNLTSEGRREFAADVKNLITDIRSILGSQFSQFEFQTLLNAYPSADFSQGANRAIINNLKEFQEIRHKEFEIAKDIKKNNKGKIPEDFQSLVNDTLAQYVDERLPSIKANTRKVMHEEYGIPEGHMLMFDPSGEPMSVPDADVDWMIENGANLP